VPSDLVFVCLSCQVELEVLPNPLECPNCHAPLHRVGTRLKITTDRGGLVGDGLPEKCPEVKLQKW
jgi:hypothetical protein